LAAAIVIVVCGGVAIAAVARLATDEPSCPDGAYPMDEWRNALNSADAAASEETRAAARETAGALARQAVDCEDLVGRAPEELARVLGAPSRTSGHGSQGPHNEWSWTASRGADVVLRAEIAGGEAVYIEADASGDAPVTRGTPPRD